MKLSQKRTCNNCNALNLLEPWYIKCDLEYKIDRDTLKPLEPCPKPLTIEDTINCNIKRNGKNTFKTGN